MYSGHMIAQTAALNSFIPRGRVDLMYRMLADLSMYRSNSRDGPREGGLILAFLFTRLMT
jgi:hypothetical protein